MGNIHFSDTVHGVQFSTQLMGKCHSNSSICHLSMIGYHQLTRFLPSWDHQRRAISREGYKEFLPLRDKEVREGKEGKGGQGRASDRKVWQVKAREGKRGRGGAAGTREDEGW